MNIKRIISIIVAVVALCNIASAQTIALDEKTPRLRRDAKWLNDHRPEKSEFTYLAFIHSASISCQASTEFIYNILNKYDNVTFILISHQSAENIDQWVSEYQGTHSGVIVDDTHTRTSFGVNYAPYAVLLNHKRRAIWFGNPQLLDARIIEELLEE